MKKSARTIIAFLIGTILSCLVFYFLFLKPAYERLERTDKALKEQAETIQNILDSVHQLNVSGLMQNLLDAIDAELQLQQHHQLSTGMINRIAAACYAFKPYSVTAEDSTHKTLLSPERGQLLLALIAMDLDSLSWMEIKAKAKFDYASLRSADLSGAVLSGIQLNYADLANANLSRADLSNASLRYASLWGASLTHAKLLGTDLTRGNLQWAELSDCNMHKVILSGAMLQSGQLRRSNLSNAIMQWASADDAFFSHADLRHADLTGTSFQNAHMDSVELDSSNLSEANLCYTHLKGASMEDVNLLVAIVCSVGWMEDLPALNITGADSISHRYSITEREFGGKTFLKLVQNK